MVYGQSFVLKHKTLMKYDARKLSFIVNEVCWQCIPKQKALKNSAITNDVIVDEVYVMKALKNSVITDEVIVDEVYVMKHKAIVKLWVRRWGFGRDVNTALWLTPRMAVGCSECTPVGSALLLLQMSPWETSFHSDSSYINTLLL